MILLVLSGCFCRPGILKTKFSAGCVLFEPNYADTTTLSGGSPAQLLLAADGALLRVGVGLDPAERETDVKSFVLPLAIQVHRMYCHEGGLQ